MSAWTDPVGVAGDAGHQIFGSQHSMMRNLEMLTKAWQTIAPKLDAGQDWRPGLASFATDWFEQLAGVPGSLTEMSKDTGALWQSYRKEWGPLLQPWLSSAIQATGSGHLGEMMLGGSEGLSRLLMMEQDEFQTAPFSGLAEIPSIGVAREHQAKILRAFDAFVDMRKVMLEFNKLTIGALNKSVETTMEKLVEKGKKGEKIESVRDLNRLWLDSADDVFTKMYASEEYLEAQHGLSKTGMTYKIMQQDVVEMALTGLNLPTRSELDDAYKTLYELRKEVKSLKKALREQAKPAIGTKATPENAIKQVVSKKKAPKRAAERKVTVSKKTASHTKSAE
jgi:class III poly(R)-hydroxyalkanoic acid synthase PhaE subunit